MKIYDCFAFGFELDLLEIRLNLLDPFVDYFVFCESEKTFSGIDKPLHYQNNQNRFKKFKNKIIHQVIDPPAEELLEEFKVKYKVKKNSFARDAYYKDSLMNVLRERCEDDDIVIWSDLDEMPNPEVLKELDSFYESNTVYNFAQDNYQGSLNWFETSGTIHSQTKDFDCGHEGPRWIGSKMGSFSIFKKYTMTELRRELLQENNVRIYPGGWHWSSCGSETPCSMHDRIMRKIQTSPHTELNNSSIIDIIESKIKMGKSPLGQNNASYKVVDFSEERFPKYLLENEEKYNYLIMENDSN